jgi:hypothetical protein
LGLIPAFPKEELTCDFCSDTHRFVAWLYRTKDLGDIEGALQLSESGPKGWGACVFCHKLIEAGDYAALLERAMSTFEQHNGNYAEVIHMAEGDEDKQQRIYAAVYTEIERVHTLFREGRIGEAVPI